MLAVARRPRPSTSASAASKTRMNSRPMILRFSSGSVTPASASRNCFCGVDDVQLDAGRGDEVALDLLGLALAQQAVVDEDAGEPVADRALHERRGDRGVDAAGQAADRPARSPICVADPLDLLLDDVDHRPGRRQPAMSCRKCSSTCWPCSVCSTSGCHCTPARPRVDVLERRDRGAVGRGEHVKPVGRRGDRVAVGHPDRVLGGDVGEQGAAARRRVTGVRPYSRAPVWATSPPRPGPSPGSRSTCRRPGRRPSKSAGSMPGRARRRRPTTGRRRG